MVLSSPSGGGKSTIARRLVASRADLTYSVSATTRSPRQGERDGASYYFLSRMEFEARVQAGEFVEWAEYGGNWYGTLRTEIDRGFAAGRHVVLDIEVQGAEQVRQRFEDTVRIFVLPPSAGVLIDRLRSRNTETDPGLVRRLEIASHELEQVSRYDYVVINDDLERAVDRVGDIIDVESSRVERTAKLDEVITRLRRDLADLVESRRLSGRDNTTRS